MVVFPLILYFSLPLLLASTSNAASRAERDSSMEPLALAYRKARLANQDLESRVDWHHKQLKQELDSGELEEEDYLADREELRQFAKRALAEIDANNKERDESARKFWESNPDLPEEYTVDHVIESLNKTLTIFENPALSALSERDGGDLLTGYIAWGSARMITKYLAVSSLREPWLRGKTILDTGAGTGFVSIVAACPGGNVIAADLPQMLPFIQKNIDANSQQLKGSGGQIRTQRLRWGDVEDIKLLPKPDIILLSGVIFKEELVEPLFITVALLSGEGTELIMCQEKWWSSTPPWNWFYSHAIQLFDLSPIEYNSVLPSGEDGYYDVWLMRGKCRREIPIFYN